MTLSTTYFVTDNLSKQLQRTKVYFLLFFSFSTRGTSSLHWADLETRELSQNSKLMVNIFASLCLPLFTGLDLQELECIL